MDQEMIKLIVEAVLGVIALFVSTYVIPWLKTRIGADKLQILEQFVQDCVRAAEQIYTPEDWTLKKDYVTRLVADKATDLGLGLNEAEIDAIIEGIVNYVKHNRANGDSYEK